MSVERCPDCGALPGQWHIRGCDIEQCPYCGGQFIQCDSDCHPTPLDDRLQWEGLWPGEAEALEWGWFCKRGRKGWRPCRLEELNGVPDLNRVRREAVWDRDKKRFVKMEKQRLKGG